MRWADEPITITVVCEAVKPGCTFVALLIAGPDRVRFSAGGDTAWEAIGWVIEEYLARTRHGRGIVPARSAADRPGDWIHRHMSVGGFNPSPRNDR